MEVLDAIAEAATADAIQSERAERIANLIREAGGYRWVGIYDVVESEIAILGWSGPGAPAHPRFPVQQGLCGAAVASRRPVVVDDVGTDPRYITKLGSTRSELVVPVADNHGRVLGVVDVESDRRAAFGSEDVRFVSDCARAALPLWLRMKPGGTRE